MITLAQHRTPLRKWYIWLGDEIGPSSTAVYVEVHATPVTTPGPIIDLVALLGAWYGCRASKLARTTDENRLEPALTNSLHGDPPQTLGCRSLHVGLGAL